MFCAFSFGVSLVPERCLCDSWFLSRVFSLIWPNVQGSPEMSLLQSTFACETISKEMERKSWSLQQHWWVLRAWKRLVFSFLFRNHPPLCWCKSIVWGGEYRILFFSLYDPASFNGPWSLLFCTAMGENLITKDNGDIFKICFWPL